MDLQKGGGGEGGGVGLGWGVEVITWGPTLHLEDSGLTERWGRGGGKVGLGWGVEVITWEPTLHIWKIVDWGVREGRGCTCIYWWWWWGELS